MPLARFCCLLALALCCPGCGKSGGGSDAEKPATSQSSLFAAPDAVKPPPKQKQPPEAFRKFFDENPELETLFVPIKGESFLSLQQALGEKGYGKATASDFKPVFTYQQAQTSQKEINATIAYTREELIPANTTFFTMTLHQFVQAVIDDAESQGAVFDPAGGSPHAFDRYQLSILNLYLNSLPAEAQAKPLSIERTKENGPTEVVGEKE